MLDDKWIVQVQQIITDTVPDDATAEKLSQQAAGLALDLVEAQGLGGAHSRESSLAFALQLHRKHRRMKKEGRL